MEEIQVEQDQLYVGVTHKKPDKLSNCHQNDKPEIPEEMDLVEGRTANIKSELEINEVLNCEKNIFTEDTNNEINKKDMNEYDIEKHNSVEESHDPVKHNTKPVIVKNKTTVDNFTQQENTDEHNILIHKVKAYIYKDPDKLNNSQQYDRPECPEVMDIAHLKSKLEINEALNKGKDIFTEDTNNEILSNDINKEDIDNHNSVDDKHKLEEHNSKPMEGKNEVVKDNSIEVTGEENSDDDRDKENAYRHEPMKEESILNCKIMQDGLDQENQNSDIDDTQDNSNDMNIDKVKVINKQQVDKQNESVNGVKIENRPEEMEIDAKQEIEDDTKYEAFADDGRVIRTYCLRERKARVNYKIEDSEKRIDQKTYYVDVIDNTVEVVVNFDNTESSLDFDNTVSSLECEECSMKFESETAFFEHVKKHTEKFTCMLCQEEFPSNNELKDHKKQHDDEKLSFTCTRCRVAFSSHLDYLLHELNHKKPSSYRCKECGKTYKKNSFRLHIPTHFHTEYLCGICDKTYKTEGHYRKHLKCHTKPSSVECMECGKRCTDKKGLDYHMISHTGVKRQQCLYCGKGFANTNSRDIHTRTHTNERPYKCKICYQKFKQSGDLKNHMDIHDSQKKFKCEFCPKTFLHKQNLTQHTRSHTLDKVFPCLECDKTFTMYQNLRSHTLHIHTSEKPHKCGVCKVQFTMMHDLRRHFKTKKHRNMMYGQKKETNGNH